MDNHQLFVLLTKLDDKVDAIAIKISSIDASLDALKSKFNDIDSSVSRINDVVWYSQTPLADLPSEVTKINNKMNARSDKYWAIISGIISLVLGLMISSSYESKFKAQKQATAHVYTLDSASSNN